MSVTWGSLGKGNTWWVFGIILLVVVILATEVNKDNAPVR